VNDHERLIPLRVSNLFIRLFMPCLGLFSTLGFEGLNLIICTPDNYNICLNSIVGIQQFNWRFNAREKLAE
jgi:hypothetical protein